MRSIQHGIRPFIRKRYLIVKILFQVGILAGMVLLAMRPLIDGKEIRLPVEARDPRDIFRGDYVELRYGFSSLKLDSIPNNLNPEKQYEFGDRLFLELKQRGPYYEAVGLWTRPPKKNMFMEVVVQDHYGIGGYTATSGRRSATGIISVRAGIEEFFASPATARHFDSLLTHRADTDIRVIAYVKVSDDGKARIRTLKYSVEK
jgi:uncharacterized membrane-anchored protein